jgi:hypothetical protein
MRCIIAFIEQNEAAVMLGGGFFLVGFILLVCKLWPRSKEPVEPPQPFISFSLAFHGLGREKNQRDYCFAWRKLRFYMGSTEGMPRVEGGMDLDFPRDFTFMTFEPHPDHSSGYGAYRVRLSDRLTAAPTQVTSGGPEAPSVLLHPGETGFFILPEDGWDLTITMPSLGAFARAAATR